MGVDWAFWVLFLLSCSIGFVGGWVMRAAVQREMDWHDEWAGEIHKREVMKAKSQHPAYRDVGWWE